MKTFNEIAFGYCSDKAKSYICNHNASRKNGHNYGDVYDIHFKALRDQPIHLLEIGIGDHKGDGLEIWAKYFPNSQCIIGADYNRDFLQGKSHFYLYPQISTEYVDQGNEQSLLELRNKFTTSYFDIIIDDGSHQKEHIIQTKKYLWPLLKNGGFYVIEDTYDSFIKPNEIFEPNIPQNSILNQIKFWLLSLNRNIPQYPHQVVENIASIHCYTNLIIIQKGESICQ